MDENCHFGRLLSELCRRRLNNLFSGSMKHRATTLFVYTTMFLASCTQQPNIEAEIISAPDVPISFSDGEDYQFFYTQHGKFKSEIHMVVYCKAKNAWARLLRVPTKGASFGYVPRDSPLFKEMAVTFDNRACQTVKLIDPLKCGLPDKVTRNQKCIILHYNSFLQEPRAATKIPINKSDLNRIFY